MKRIYLCPSHLDGSERELLLQAYDLNRIITLGPQVNAFEQEMCEKNRGEACCCPSNFRAIKSRDSVYPAINPPEECERDCKLELFSV
jgi:dTDP-4-amino-4,6-dideoxygalactose transaminase